MLTNNLFDHDVFEVFDDVSDIFMASRKLKAVTTAIDETFTGKAEGVDLAAINDRPEHFRALFDTLRDLVVEIHDLAAKADDATDACFKSRQRAAGADDD